MTYIVLKAPLNSNQPTNQPTKCCMLLLSKDLRFVCLTSHLELELGRWLTSVFNILQQQKCFCVHIMNLFQIG